MTFGRMRSWMVAGTLVVGATAAFSAPPQAPAARPDLLNPASLNEKAPTTFNARFDTTKGVFVVKVTRNWAPNGADRFYNLVKAGYYNENRFFRVLKDNLAQFGIHGDPNVNAAWVKATIPPDRARMSNTRGRLSFAMATPDTRTTQVFINFSDNDKLDLEGFAAFGEITTSMVLIQRIFDQYGEGPDQVMILAGGNAFLQQYMPQLDYIRTAVITEN